MTKRYNEKESSTVLTLVFSLSLLVWCAKWDAWSVKQSSFRLQNLQHYKLCLGEIGYDSLNLFEVNQ